MKREREHNIYENQIEGNETMPIVESNQSDSYHDKTSGNVARKK